MKKVIALVLALIMVAAMAVAVSAAGVSETADQVQVPTLVKYGVAQEYVIVIPAEIELVEATEAIDGKTAGKVYDSKDIQVLDAVLAGNEKITITVASTTGYQENPGVSESIVKEAWTLVDTNKKSAPVSYALSTVAFDGAVTNGTVLEQVRADGNEGTYGIDKTVTLYFSSNGTAQEGTYRDRLTFTVDVLADSALQGTDDKH